MSAPSYLDRLGQGVGPDALRQMARRWVIDEAWSWDHGPTGFVWVAHRLAQRFAVEEAGGRLRLIATTTVVEGIEDGAGAREALRGYNLLSKGSMWLHDDEAGTIGLHCGVELDPDDLEARTHDLSAFALLQLYTGEVLAETLAEAAGGRPAHRSHPASGVRTEADEILTMVDQALIPIGMGPSQFGHAEEMAAAAAVLEDSAFAVSHHTDGLVVDASATVGGATVELRLDPLVGDPDLGSGLLATVRLVAESARSPEAWARHLNAADRGGDFAGPLLGAWEPHEDDGGSGVIHTWFTPNALSRMGRARDTMEVVRRRALWAAGGGVA